MTALIDHTRLHRTAKYFMDSGRAATHDDAMDILRGFGASIRVGPEAATSIAHQVALLTLVARSRILTLYTRSRILFWVETITRTPQQLGAGIKRYRRQKNLTGAAWARRCTRGSAQRLRGR